MYKYKYNKRKELYGMEREEVVIVPKENDVINVFLTVVSGLHRNVSRNATLPAPHYHPGASYQSYCW